MIRAFVRNRAPILLVTVCIFLFGLFTYIELPREAFPDIDIPVVMVSTPYTGVSPEDIESLITVPVESELAGLKDLKKMSSVSAEGVSLVTLEFEPEVVIEDALQRVRDRISRARSDLPEDAEETDIREVSMTDVPIMIVTIAGPVDEEVLKVIGEGLEDEFSRINGVLDTDLAGGRTRQFRVQIDPHRLTHYSLKLDDVIDAIRDENVNIPGGDVRVGDANFLLRVPGEFTEAHEIESVAVKRIGDRPVFVRDLGRVIDAFEDRDSYARVNGESAVTIGVKKRGGANLLEIADEVKSILAAREGDWPEGVRFRIIGDQSRDIAMMVNDLENNIITALILVVAVIFFFMGARNSFFIAIAIPLSMLMAMLFIQAFDMTLNMIVLFSLILSLGMLVDNAIVIIENIYRHAEEGLSLVEASIVGTKEVGMAVTASTLTTVAAFAPLLFWTGMMGQFMGFLPKTVVIVLLCSLAIAIAVLPVITSRSMKVSRKGSGAERQTGRAMTLYKALLEWSIAHRYLSLGIGVAALVGTFAAYGELNHGTEFFPDVEPDRATVSVRAPDGTDVEATDEIVRRVEAILLEQENINFYVAETGVSGGGSPMAGASQSAGNSARITIDFLPHATRLGPGETPRIEDPRDTISRIRAGLVEIPGASIEIEKERKGPPVGSPISVEVSGDDVHSVGAYAARVRRDLAALDGATSLRDNYRVGRPEMRLRIDRGAAKRVGASTSAVATAIRTAVAGSVATTIRDGEDEYDVVVEMAPEHRGDLQAVLALRIPGREDTSPDSFAVPLSAVASYELAGGSGSINHIDQDLVVTIDGDVKEGFNENAIRDRVSAFIAEAEPPEGLHLRLGGASDEQRESQEFLSRAFLIAVFLILMVLVAQFNRFDLPLIILASVILSLIGVLWGLIITGTSFGIIMTGIGVISLAGVVVNNAIVLLDYVEQLRARGHDLHDALIEAGMTRFRPVIITALTTILGLVPMAAGVSFDFWKMEAVIGSPSAQWWGPMAVAVVFGLAVATVLTLVLVPTMYSILEDIRITGERFLAKMGRGAAAPPKPTEAE